MWPSPALRRGGPRLRACGASWSRHGHKPQKTPARGYAVGVAGFGVKPRICPGSAWLSWSCGDWEGVDAGVASLTGAGQPTGPCLRCPSIVTRQPPPRRERPRFRGPLARLRGMDSNPDYLIQSQASYH